MPRHSKNVTSGAGSGYTTHERLKDGRESGWGTQAIRLGKDSMKPFDCCSLTLQPCKIAVVTPDGHLYDKEAILENICFQKIAIAKKIKDADRLRVQEQRQADELQRSSEMDAYQKYTAKQGLGITEDLSKNSLNSLCSLSKRFLSNDRPDITPPILLATSAASKSMKLKNLVPAEVARCPMSGKRLQLKDLTTVTFTHVNDRDKRSLISKEVRYVCAVTNDVLGNSVPCAVLKTSGSVVTMECVEMILKKDWIDPINGKTLTEKDIIPLQRGSSGFAGSGLVLEAKKQGAVMMA